jgi:hypothetical protein
VFRVLASQAGRQVLAGQQNATQIIDDFQRGQR